VRAPELVRADVDGRDVDGERERLAVAVDDRAPVRCELDAGTVLRRREAAELGAAQQGQVDGADGDQDEEPREQAGHREHAALRRPLGQISASGTWTWRLIKSPPPAPGGSSERHQLSACGLAHPEPAARELAATSRIAQRR